MAGALPDRHRAAAGRVMPVRVGGWLRCRTARTLPSRSSRTPSRIRQVRRIEHQVAHEVGKLPRGRRGLASRGSGPTIPKTPSGKLRRGQPVTPGRLVAAEQSAKSSTRRLRGFCAPFTRVVTRRGRGFVRAHAPFDKQLAGIGGLARRSWGPWRARPGVPQHKRRRVLRAGRAADPRYAPAESLWYPARPPPSATSLRPPSPPPILSRMRPNSRSRSSDDDDVGRRHRVRTSPAAPFGTDSFMQQRGLAKTRERPAGSTSGDPGAGTLVCLELRA